MTLPLKASIKHLIVILVLAIGLPMFLCINAQGELILEQEPLTIMPFDSTKLNEYRRLDAFNYEEHIPEPSLIEKFLKWLSDKLGTNRKQSQQFWNITGYIIAAFAIILIIFTLLRVKISGLFAREASTQPDWNMLTEEGLQGTNFQEEINTAISQGNYRLAIRMQYLETIKKLSEEGLIEWRPDKTNHIYVRELSDTALQKDFQEIVRFYEYAWYGDFPIDQSKFHFLKSLYEQFVGNIKTR